MSVIPIADGLFTWPSDEPQLIGSRCTACATTVFPNQPSCPKCGSATEERLLSRSGSLWSYTVQGFRPKPPYNGPEEFEPYGVGYVELPGEVMVEARLTETDPDALEIGIPMELVVIPYRQDEDGNDVVTFAFKRFHDAAGEAPGGAAVPNRAFTSESGRSAVDDAAGDASGGARTPDRVAGEL